MMEENTVIYQGDWVRFYQNGKLVIGRVEYITKDSGYWEPAVHTDIGSVMHKNILEVRRDSV